MREDGSESLSEANLQSMSAMESNKDCPGGLPFRVAKAFNQANHPIPLDDECNNSKGTR